MHSVCLFVALGLSGIYLLPSGYPQICDVFFIGFVCVIAWKVFSDQWRVTGDRFLGVWFILVLWISAVSLVWVLIYQQSSEEIALLMLWPPLFYWFNFLVGASMLVYLRHSPRGVLVLIAGVSISLLISAMGVLLGIGEGGRVTAFFNNPNQLAHYSLCGLAILLIAHKGRIPLRPLPLAAGAAGTIGILAPASLGAMVGLGLIAVGWGLANAQHFRRILQGTAAATLLIVVVLAFDVYTQGGIADSLINRFNRAEGKVAELSEGKRGYDRVLAYPQHWILGAGEGAWGHRFTPYHQGVEIHSSLGTLLFSYGVVGLGLFLLLLWMIVKGSPFYISCAIGGLLLYSLTHMGLRTTAFWVVLVLARSIYSPSAASAVTGERTMRGSEC
jgi:hypothetical protein